MLEDTTKFQDVGGSKFLLIPSKVLVDSAFPFPELQREKEEWSELRVIVRIEKDKIVIEREKKKKE